MEFNCDRTIHTPNMLGGELLAHVAAAAAAVTTAVTAAAATVASAPASAFSAACVETCLARNLQGHCLALLTRQGQQARS